jgi:hypothetical protein
LAPYRKKPTRQYVRSLITGSGVGQQTLNVSFGHRYFERTPISGMKDIYWRVPTNLIGPNALKWGFDSTDVDEERWNTFLRGWNFTVVDAAPDGRAIWKNPDGIFMAHTYNRKEGPDKRFLGYMRFEAPKEKESELKMMLKDFRGPKPVSDDWEPEFGQDTVATYVKGESPRKADFV